MQQQQHRPEAARTSDRSPACWHQAPRLTLAGMASEGPVTSGVFADVCNKAPVDHADT